MKKLCWLIVLMTAVWFVGFLLFNRQINSFVLDSQTPTEAIIVLTGGRNRIPEATKLYNLGLADKMFISGVNQKSSLRQIENRNAISIKSKDHVHLGLKARDTIGNAVETNEWLRQNNIKSIRLVTSNYHIPRSLLEFQARNNDLQIIVHPVYSDKVQKKWWKSWGSFCLIATEYNKFLYVLLTKNIIEDW